MPRGKKKTGLSNDSSIFQAHKKIKQHRKLLERAAGNPESNEIDDLNDELERGNEPDSVRTIFED